jgi:hypothetical protein
MKKHSNDQHASDGSNVHHGPTPYWQRAHNDWRFWIGVVLMFAAMIIYVMSIDLAWRPGHQPQPVMSDPVGK